MNKELIESIRNDPWLEPTSCTFMNFYGNMPSWLLLERILLNVSVSFESNWKDVWNAEEANGKHYKALVISLVLIDRELAKFCFLSTVNRRSLIGERNWLILQQYQAAA